MRDIVDSRRNLLGLFMPAALLMIFVMLRSVAAGSALHLPRDAGADGRHGHRRAFCWPAGSNKVDVKFPDNTESSWKLGIYAAGRASQLRRMRAPGHGSTAATKSTDCPAFDAHPGARRYPVGQVPLGRDGRRRVRATVGARALSGDRTSLRRRPGLGHPRRRPPAPPAGNWQTVESADVATQLRAEPEIATLVDDVGGWLTAAMDRTRRMGGGFGRRRRDRSGGGGRGVPSPLALVSPEVGLTVVPATEAGRRFADALGELNQRLAAACDRVVLVVAGVAVPIKPERGL